MTRVAYSPEAHKTLRRLPANVAGLIRTKIEQYAVDPASLANNVKTLKGETGTLRLRVGDWRAIFTVKGDQLTVIRIRPRGSAYD